ncbi:MAG: CvpA family protein [Gammaproteobacteria bacterium]|nr:CvpA family protein [Gammaproteobacteria bacterium]
MGIELTLLNEIDWVILLAFVVMFMYGISQGLGRVLTSLLLWASSFILAELVSRLLSIPLSAYIDDPELLVLVPFSISFFFSMMVFNLLFSFLTFNTERTPLMRSLGGLLSLPLVMVQLLVLVSFARLLTLDESTYWFESQLVPFVLRVEYYWATYVMDNVCTLLPAAQCYPY